MKSGPEKVKPGQKVILVALPPGLLNGLPEEDQRGITAIVGRPVDFVGYDEDGRAELRFTDPFDVQTEKYSHSHSIWVPPAYVERYEE